MHALAVLLAALSAVAVALAAGPELPAGPDLPPDPDPSPELTPTQVIRIQVEALRTNDEPREDAGIALAFRFASPGNRSVTGPLSRFKAMVHRGYADMLGFDYAEYGPLRVEGDQAAQRVTLVQADGRRSTYLFGLSRQRGGPCDGCWMTDAVMPAPPVSNGQSQI